MKGTMLIFGPMEPAIRRTYERALELQDLQDAVKGYIEVVALFDLIEIDGEQRRCCVMCNENGKLDNLPVNAHATRLWGQALEQHGVPMFDVLVGNVAVIYGDDEFMEAL